MVSILNDVTVRSNDSLTDATTRLDSSLTDVTTSSNDSFNNFTPNINASINGTNAHDVTTASASGNGVSSVTTEFGGAYSTVAETITDTVPSRTTNKLPTTSDQIASSKETILSSASSNFTHEYSSITTNDWLSTRDIFARSSVSNTPLLKTTSRQNSTMSTQTIKVLTTKVLLINSETTSTQRTASISHGHVPEVSDQSFSTPTSSSEVTLVYTSDATVSTNASINSTDTIFDSDVLTTSVPSTEPSGYECLPLIGVVSTVSAVVVVLVILASILCMLRTRRKWRRKLKEEKLRTDIWTMSTFNNTIINDNFADYTLDTTTPMPSRKKDGKKWKKDSQKTQRSSTGSRDLIQSWYSDGSRNTSSSLRRNTFSEPKNIGKNKQRVPRQTSEYSDDFRYSDGQYERGRTSTFSIGWNFKARDRSTLVSHEEAVDMSSDDPGVFQIETSIPRNDHIVTEL